MSDAETSTTAIDPASFKTFAEFYPFYLGEHRNQTCRRMHFVGSTLALRTGTPLVWLCPSILSRRVAPVTPTGAHDDCEATVELARQGETEHEHASARRESKE